MPDDTPQPGTVAKRTKRAHAPGITVETISASTPGAGYEKHRGIFLRADSLAKLAAFLKSPAGAARGAFAPQVNTGSRVKFSCDKKGKQWDLSAGWNGAVEIARDGWKEGRKGLKTAAASLAGEFQPRTPTAFDVAGDWLDIPSAIAGDPEHWGYDEDAPGRARIIRLSIPLSAPWHVDAAILRNRGAALVAIIDGLEAEGIRCEVEGYSGHERAQDEAACFVCHRIKEAGAHLSLDRLAASLIHPATFRRIHFAGLEYLGGETIDGFAANDLVHGYGGAAGLREPLRPFVDPPGTYHLPLAQNGDFSTPEKAAQTIREQMKDLGFTFTDSKK